MNINIQQKNAQDDEEDENYDQDVEEENNDGQIHTPPTTTNKDKGHNH